jgi:uncharacterized protein (TIGR03437 family)
MPALLRRTWQFAVLLLLQAATQIHAAEPLIWFAPHDNMPRPWKEGGGALDYMTLFSPDAPWSTAASRVRVFKMYNNYVVWLSDSDLRRIIEDLNRRGIALATEIGGIDYDGTCGQGVEGFTSLAYEVAIARRIKEAGGTLRYAALDEPLFYGSIYKGPNACNWPPEKIARKVWEVVTALRKVFPDLMVGDIEPFTGVPRLAERYEEWINVYRSVTGADLAFFHADVSWSYSAWFQDVADVREYAEQRQIPFGMIYNGSGERSDIMWVKAAEEHMVGYELRTQRAPAHVIFQSWEPYPTHLLPETDPTAFTYLINRYARVRTILGLTLSGSALAGTLADAAGNTISSAPVALAATPTDGPGLAEEITVMGTVPPDARQAVVGVRVNLEDAICTRCRSDFWAYRFNYAQADGINRVRNPEFALGWQEWGFSGTGKCRLEPSDRSASSALHFTTAPGETIMLNSSYFPVTGGASYTFSVTAKVPPLSTGSGYFAVIFLNSNSEVRRHRVQLATATVLLGKPLTGKDGSFALALPVLPPSNFEYRAEFAGDDGYWPARASWLSAPSPGPQVSSNGTVNAASFRAEPVAPGEIVTIYGLDIGPAELQHAAYDAAGQLPTLLFDTKVLFGGIRAPLIWVQAEGISAIVPYGVSGRTTVQVECIGRRSNTLALPVAPTAPGIFTYAAGRGQAVAVNQDGSLNSENRPAARRTVLTIFATGEGRTDPPGMDGRLPSPPTYPSPASPLRITLGGVECPVEFKGLVYAGLLQLNMQIPAEVPPGSNVPLILEVGGASSQPGVTVAVR